MSSKDLSDIFSMGDHGIYVWAVFGVLLLLLITTYVLLEKKIIQAKKEIDEEG
tara:strand:+ start:5098 stop:5256 length:159 start_codon:yes stop_codon:yes gene_type:complete